MSRSCCPVAWPWEALLANVVWPVFNLLGGLGVRPIGNLSYGLGTAVASV